MSSSSSAKLAVKANKFKEFIKEQFGLPFLLTAFGLAVANIIQHNKCTNTDKDKFKDDSLVKLFYWASILIIVFCCLMAVLEFAPVMMG